VMIDLDVIRSFFAGHGTEKTSSRRSLKQKAM
jgi:hypothetical protein